MCGTCSEKLQPEQSQLAREVARHNLSTHVDYSSDARYWNAPYAMSLDIEIKKASYTLYNLCHLELLKDSHISLSMLQRARGFMFLTVVKGGLMIAPKVGTGMIISRLTNGRYIAVT